MTQEGPVSIERLHQVVGVRACDLVTIYRCLAAFEDLGLVRRSYLHNGTCLYELTSGTDRRYHIVCKTCGRTDPIDFTFASDTEQKLQDKGYTRISHVLEFFGVCPACQQAAKTSRETTVCDSAGGISGPIKAGHKMPDRRLRRPHALCQSPDGITLSVRGAKRRSNPGWIARRASRDDIRVKGQGDWYSIGASADQRSGFTACTHSFTGLPPSRCSRRMRSKRSGVTLEYQMPSG